MLQTYAESRLQDLSDRDSFCFGVTCQRCKDVLRTAQIPFVKAGIPPENENQRTLFEVLYRRDKQLEQERAVKTLVSDLNLCPVCRRLVCNRCFMISEDIDLCVYCADKLGLHGEIVADGQPEDGKEPSEHCDAMPQGLPVCVSRAKHSLK